MLFEAPFLIQLLLPWPIVQRVRQLGLFHTDGAGLGLPVHPLLVSQAYPGVTVELLSTQEICA